MISLFVPVITCPAPLLTANKRLCVCHGIRSAVSPLFVSFSHPSPLLTTTYLLLCPPSLFFRHLFFSMAFCPLCTYCRLALDDAIRHKQLNISRFSPRVAGESDFLQTVINKVITAKEVNHKGQGTVSVQAGYNGLIFIIIVLIYRVWLDSNILLKYYIPYFTLYASVPRGCN